DFYEKAFWAGMEAFRKESYLETVASLAKVLEAWSSSPENHKHLGTAANVYGLALIKSGRQREAVQAVASFYEKGLLDEEGLYNCGLVALQGGDFQLAYEVLSQGANSVENPSFDFYYLAAISCFNLGKWQDSEVFFKKSLQQQHLARETMEGAKKAFFQNYYLGLAQFRQGKLEASYDTLEPLCQLKGGAFQSASFAAEKRQTQAIAQHCALQLYFKTNATSWWKKGAVLAQNFVNSAESPRQKQEAVLLAAKIYGDGGQYQQALELLSPYTGGQDDLSLSCRFLRCELLTSLGKLDEAIQAYGELAEICGSFHDGQQNQEVVALGDRAAYRQGELLYSQGKNREAASAFALYRRHYPAGSYRDAALYFNGEALEKEGETHQAILQHETLLKQHPSSPYVFSSMVGLVDLYKKTGEYDRGLAVGNHVLSQFPQQAQEVNIQGKMAELRFLSQGMELNHASVLAKFQQAGKTRTVAGRKLGLELAHFYVNDFEGADEGEMLLLKILEQCGAGEEAVAAGATLLLGDLYRGQNRYQEAAGYFLQAAQSYLAMGNLQEEAASALYRGAESFDAAGMTADSRAVAHRLAALFPKSPWTRAAKIFL
ncbi:MAG: tetratricopeptide repeat protein, partial [Spirochaetaceae bacterium]|nr:tetratricopeptide repeat protein [Spirochaetaceae bacterium]